MTVLPSEWFPVTITDEEAFNVLNVVDKMWLALVKTVYAKVNYFPLNLVVIEYCFIKCQIVLFLWFNFMRLPILRICVYTVFKGQSVMDLLLR